MNSAQLWHTRQLFKAWLLAMALTVVGYLLDISYPQGSWILPGLNEMTPSEAFFFAIKSCVLEVTALYVILRPWTFTNRTRYRALLALVLFLPYFGYLLIFGPGKDFSQAVHLLWVMGVLLTLGLATIKPSRVADEVSAEREPKRLL